MASPINIYHWWFNDSRERSTASGKWSARSAEIDPERSEASLETPLKNKTWSEQTGYYYYGARSRRDFEHKPKRRSATLARPSPAFWRGYYNPKWSVPALSGVEGWLGVDPMATNYPHSSPYVFTANNPINAIDPDGNVVIFINGLHSGEGGNRRYWGETAQVIAAQFKDFNARFYDGSSGGTRNTSLLAWSASFTFGASLFGWNVFSVIRHRYGRHMGYRQAAAIYASLEDGETIKIATHSMGGAYAKGFIKGLRKYAKEQGWEDDRIERLLDIATFQPRHQNKVEGVNHEQLSDNRDWLGTSGKIDGIGDGYFNVGEDEEGRSLQYHTLPNFHDAINWYIIPGDLSNSPNPTGPELNVQYEECN